MTTRFGAPGTGLSRREFLAATGVTGVSSLAGCSGGRANTAATTNTPTQTQSDGGDLPYTGSPTVVDVDDQGGKVTMRTQQARHAVHPLDTMGGPVEFPRVWAFQADDNAPSVPGPILRTTEGSAMEVTLDNTGGRRAHTIHFHGVRKTWENDGDRLAVEATNPWFDTAFDATGDDLAERVPTPAETLRTLRNRTDTGEQFITEQSHRTPNGQRHHVVELVPYDIADGEKRSYILFQDVTEIREAEAELERTVEQLERSNEQLQQFAYVASHDLQEPLRMVSSYVDLLAAEYGDELDEEADEYIEFAVDGARRMQAMIDDLLQYSRVHTRGGEFEEVDTEAVLDRVLKDLELLLVERDATVTHDDLPSLVADENQLGQLLQNLISNAVEHADDGESPAVHVSAERTADATVLSVADDGPGIPEDQQDRVFEIFEQSSRDDEGTGIGLAICQRIVDRHGGNIWIESAVGEGTTFHIELPDHTPQQSTPGGQKA